MELVTVEINIPTDLYIEAKEVLSKIGYTVEEACVLFFEETVRLGRFPFEYTPEDLDEAKRAIGEQEV